jgi:hypothetical protein
VQAPAEELEREVDLVEREVRQRLVQQPDLVEQRRAAALDVLARAQVEVRELALVELAHAVAPAASQARAATATRRARDRRSDGAAHGKPRACSVSSRSR